MNIIRGLLSALLSCRSRCRMLVLWVWMTRAAAPRRQGAAIPEFMCALFLMCVGVLLLVIAMTSFTIPEFMCALFLVCVCCYLLLP